jgi:two-component system response regulator HydG
MICRDERDQDGSPTLGELVEVVRRVAKNVEELERCVERAAADREGRRVEPKESSGSVGGSNEIPRIPGASLWELERYAILETLEHVGGSTSKAARILQISPRKIQYRLSEYRRANDEKPPVPKRVERRKR